MQAASKKAGRPWNLAKGFDLSAACGLLRPASQTGALNGGRIALSVDGAIRQESDLSQMIWSVADVIAHLSQSVRLEPGDLIFTGTPAGWGRSCAGRV